MTQLHRYTYENSSKFKGCIVLLMDKTLRISMKLHVRNLVTA